MKRFLFAVVICTLGAALAAQQPPMGQQSNPAKQPGTVLKGKTPVSKDVLKVSLPKSQEADLSNGIHLIVVEDHRAPQVFFTLLVDGAGGYYDPQASPGLATFTAALMREGTTTKTSEQISEQLDRLAASVSVGAGISSRIRAGHGHRPDQQPRHRARLDGGRGDEPVVPAGRDRSLQDALEGELDQPADASPGFWRRSA